MSTTLTIELPVHFQRCGHGSRKELRAGAEAPALPPGDGAMILLREDNRYRGES